MRSEFNQASKLVSIIFATYNEKEHIEQMINEVFTYIKQPVEVIVVDDASPDGTGDIVEKLMKKYENLKLIRRKAKGLASAFNRGIIESRGDIVGWMDADTCMPVKMLPDMISKLSEFDIVIGSRYAPGGKDDRTFLRTFSSRLINGLASLILGHGIKDYDSGFVILKRSVFDYVTIHPSGYGAYFIEFIYNACEKGLKVYEMPFHFKDRQVGVSKSAPSMYKFLKTGSGYVWRIFRARVRHID